MKLENLKQAVRELKARVVSAYPIDREIAHLIDECNKDLATLPAGTEHVYSVEVSGPSRAALSELLRRIEKYDNGDIPLGWADGAWDPIKNAVAALKEQIENANTDLSRVPEPTWRAALGRVQELEKENLRLDQTLSNVQQRVANLRNERRDLRLRQEADRTTIAELQKRIAELEKQGAVQVEPPFEALVVSALPKPERLELLGLVIQAAAERLKKEGVK